MNISDISPYLIYKFKSESELVSAIEILSQNFTSNRENISNYHKDEKLIAAYAAFYLTTNFPKFAHCMGYLKEYESLFIDYEIVDIGVGPGTFLFAIGTYFNWNTGTLYGIETSHLMKKQAIKIRDGLYADKDIEIVSKPALIPKKTRKRLVIFTHSMNEMGQGEAIKYIEELEADGVMFIEPGTKAFFKEYLKVRSELLEGEFSCHYPCPSDNACPVENQDDWCHQYVKLSHDLEVSRLTQITHKNRKWQAMTLGLYLKSIKRDKVLGRIIRTYPETKFGFSWDVCHRDRIDLIEVLKRDYTKLEVKKIGSFLAGAKINFKIIKELKDKIRVFLNL